MAVEGGEEAGEGFSVLFTELVANGAGDVGVTKADDAVGFGDFLVPAKGGGGTAGGGAAEGFILVEPWGAVTGGPEGDGEGFHDEIVVKEVDGAEGLGSLA